MTQERYAIATLLMGGNSYVPGAIALAKSLHLHINKKDIDFICMVTKDVTDRVEIARLYTRVIEVEKITVQNLPSMGSSASKIYSWINDSPTKWNILSFTEYKKILFLDCDIVILSNISRLFNLSCPAAVFDHQSAREYAQDPLWTGNKEKGSGFINWYKLELGYESFESPFVNNYTYKFPTGVKIPQRIASKLAERSNCQFALHGGVVLIEPNIEEFHLYKQYLQSIVDSLCKKVKNGKRISYVKTDKLISGIDEITIQLFYCAMNKLWTNINIEYNIPAYHLFDIIRDDIKILHYVGVLKPWKTSKFLSQEEVKRVNFWKDKKYTYTSHKEVENIWNFYYDFQIM